jgi:hypothetical protein
MDDEDILKNNTYIIEGDKDTDSNNTSLFSIDTDSKVEIDLIESDSKNDIFDEFIYENGTMKISQFNFLFSLFI